MKSSEKGPSTLALPISKLRGVPPRARIILKARRITNCRQLIDAAGKAKQREELARSTGIAHEQLLRLAQRADMSRLVGVGAVFGFMLEQIGVNDVPSLAGQSSEKLYEKLRLFNQRERLARRSPTPEEVEDWVTQARALDPVVTYNVDGKAITSDMPYSPGN